MIEHQRYKCIGVIVSSLLLTPPILAGEDREQLVATARDGNQAAIQSITSMECRFERKPWANSTLEQVVKHWHLFSPGKFWRSGDVYRMTKPKGKAWQDCVVRNGRGLFLLSGGGLPRPQLTYDDIRPVDGVGGDMWKWLLFGHWGPVLISYYPFHDLLDNPHVIRTVERLPPPDNSIHIELTHDAGRLEFWFDPKVNYLVRKTVMIPTADKNYRWESEVVEFTEGAPAVFVPTTIEYRCSIKGELQATLRTILSEVKVNQPLAEDALRIPGITGMECIDMNREVSFKVDADGNPIGPESPVAVGHLSPTGKPGGTLATPSGSYVNLEPSKPSTPWWMWMLLASLMVLATAVIAAIVRRRRQTLHT